MVIGMLGDILDSLGNITSPSLSASKQGVHRIIGSVSVWMRSSGIDVSAYNEASADTGGRY